MIEKPENVTVVILSEEEGKEIFRPVCAALRLPRFLASLPGIDASPPQVLSHLRAWLGLQKSLVVQIRR